MNLAVIPARGGSKRIPRKNIKDFCGKPIIAYSIEAAINSGLFDKIIVSTDDEEIAQIARNYGAEVPFLRPKELADDYTGTTAVAKHAIEWYLERKIEFDNVCLIYATAPLLTQEALAHGLKILSTKNKKMSFSATKFRFPIDRALDISAEGEVSPYSEKHIKKRSQDLSTRYHDAGQFYWAKPQCFINEQSFFSSESSAVIIPTYLVQDIDDMQDWKLAQCIYQTFNRE